MFLEDAPPSKRPELLTKWQKRKWLQSGNKECGNKESGNKESGNQESGEKESNKIESLMIIIDLRTRKYSEVEHS